MMKGHIMGPYLPDAVRHHAAERPEAPAVSEGELTLTYADLHSRSNRIAQALLAEGLKTGSHVGYLVRPGLMSAELLVACAKSGLVATPLNWRLGDPELTDVALDAELEAVITQEEFLPRARAIRDAYRVLPLISGGEPVGGERTYESWLGAMPDRDPGLGTKGCGDTVFLQLYTSGTTGLPKGVQLTLRNLDMGEYFQREVGWSERCVSLNAMPGFHIAGKGWLVQALVAGAHTIMMPNLTPEGAVDVMEKERVTHALFVPAVLHMLTTVEDVGERDFSALQLISYGGSPIAPAALLRSMEIFGCDFCQRYGQTETAASVTRLLPADHDPDGSRAHLLHSAGNAWPDVEVAVADPVTGQFKPPGAVGEIYTRSHHLTPGYWKRPDENNRLFTKDGWLKTGDAGYLDEEGYLFITDRIKDMVITGGENVYPIEVESVLAEHPAVSEVAVFGTPDEKWGEVVTAAVVLKAGASDITSDELIDFTRQRIASYKKPRIVHFVDELPRNPSGKILKRVLRDSVGRGARPISRC
ncbi:Acyl-CoA synthetase (AMP-forming)/AMP-acid ligase II [Streptomyces melanosporofaciens]|uniref:Acyl-CoA synthetase (AMP-forming)/AMP-acid ligase II n=2 Tax=Streptomyces melanosporofaciens TaxID=67327 RepID=A0A1H4KKK3_STRMJ|nr:Acyl-CoA synthetase (AMP-forming)/AMP-acid ligase II [Streptomyces melanosporofaciens]